MYNLTKKTKFNFLLLNISINLNNLYKLNYCHLNISDLYFLKKSNKIFKFTLRNLLALFQHVRIKLRVFSKFLRFNSLSFSLKIGSLDSLFMNQHDLRINGQLRKNACKKFKSLRCTVINNWVQYFFIHFQVC